MTRDEITDWHEAHPWGERDDKYIDAVLAHVKAAWMQARKERLGQLLYNIAGRSDIFHTPDEEWAPPRGSDAGNQG